MAPKGAEEYIHIATQRAVEKKTHVTFPQLKYPSLRDSGVKDGVQWLEGKAMDDGAEGLWRVHNGLYDLDTFLNKHPGGAEWLNLTKGTDITEAYECHHLSKSVDKVLEKYYVRDAQTPRNSPFTFEDDGFFRTLKRAMAEELPKVPKDVAKESDRITDGLLATYLLSSAFCCYTTIPILVNLSWLLAALTVAWTVVASHNYIHRKSNWRMHFFSLALWCYRDFRISHALSHHLYPNTLMDLEVSSFEPLVYWNPRQDKSFISRYFTFFIELLYFPFAFHVNFFIRSFSAIFRKGYFQNHWRITDLVGLLVPIWMWLVSGTTFYHAVVTWTWIQCTGSFIFYMIGSNAAHHHPDIWKDGDQPSYDTETPDWGVHQLEAVMDRKDINSNHFGIMTFFGNHALHHLFPTIDHAVLTYLYPTFIEHAKKFRANFSYNTETTDWGVHELEAVMDRKDINDNHFRIMTFFGNHALHHLFPTLDHAVLTYLYPIFVEHAKKFRANFRTSNQFDLFIGQYRCAYNTNFKIRDYKEE